MESRAELKLKPEVITELKIVVAEVNAKGIGTFMEDLFMAWINRSKQGEQMPELKKVEVSADENARLVNYRIGSSILYEMRILAAKNGGMSLKAYMECIYNWLAEEHRKNGRVWLDDTPVRALPVRMKRAI